MEKAPLTSFNATQPNHVNTSVLLHLTRRILHHLELSSLIIRTSGSRHHGNGLKHMRKKEMNMEGKRIRISTDVEMQACSKLDHPKRTISLVLKPGTLMLTCLIFLPLLVLVLGATRNPSLKWLFSVGITSGIGNPR
ncbi:hypothetical protein Cni_G17542 [Canna indica]|uniref:Transmembrane protein n=1 Tax=Canna indica TaxID=4628 RepID=A0AAQ3QF86_9LILI|nr:hypothetical protein Cni_G17542 [Canna indica]